MKIQNINNWGSQPNAVKNAKTSVNSFEHIFKNQAKNDKPIENSLPLTHNVSITEQIDSVRSLTIPNIRQIDLVGLENLLKDAFSNTGEQILHEIDDLCNDEAGESIDIKLLDDLLELYKESR